MSENTEEQNVDVEVAGTPEEPQYSEIELQALEQGWTPKDGWKGDPEEWRPAKEFVDRGNLFRKIESQKNELHELRKAIGALSEHNQKVFDAGYKRAMSDLKEAKKAALKEGDGEAVVQIEEQMDSLTEEYQERSAAFNAPQQQRQPDPLFMSWLERNQWYGSDRKLRGYADSVTAEYLSRNPSANLKEVLVEVDKEMRTAFPQKFGTTKAPPSPEGSNRASGSGGNRRSAGDVDLNDEERKIMNTLIRSGVITKEKYLEDLKKVRGE
jgi:uncharacterized membrane protein